jgi:hypothetical protein
VEVTDVARSVMVLGWGSPIGIGIFLVCLATMIFILSKVKKEK